MQKGIFVTGTNTGIGKTVTSSLILSALQSHSISCGYFKPIQTGLDLDTKTVRELTHRSSSQRSKIQFVSPVYSLALAAAPLRAAAVEGKIIYLDSIQTAWHKLDSNPFWIVEGAGGLLVPLNATETLRDLILQLQLDLVVIASTRLGTMNHTLLTIEAAQKVGIRVLGLVLVGDQDPGLDQILTRFSNVPVIAEVPKSDDVNPSWITEMGPLCFSKELLEKLRRS